MKRNIKKAIPVFLLLVCLTAGQAFATVIGTIDLSNHANTYSSQVNVSISYIPVSGRYFSGIYNWTTSNPTGAGSLVPTWGFCIDMYQNNGSGTYTYNVDNDLTTYPIPTGAMGIQKAKLVQELWSKYFDASWPASNQWQAGSFGAAVWEIVYETATDGSGNLILDITSGACTLNGFQNGASEENLCKTMLSSLSGNGPYASQLAVASSNWQDFITIPEPATISMLALGVLGLLKKRKA
jgi:hypothetical protein